MLTGIQAAAVIIVSLAGFGLVMLIGELALAVAGFIKRSFSHEF